MKGILLSQFAAQTVKHHSEDYQKGFKWGYDEAEYGEGTGTKLSSPEWIAGYSEGFKRGIRDQEPIDDI